MKMIDIHKEQINLGRARVHADNFSLPQVEESGNLWVVGEEKGRNSESSMRSSSPYGVKWS